MSTVAALYHRKIM